MRVDVLGQGTVQITFALLYQALRRQEVDPFVGVLFLHHPRSCSRSPRHALRRASTSLVDRWRRRCAPAKTFPRSWKLWFGRNAENAKTPVQTRAQETPQRCRERHRAPVSFSLLNADSAGVYEYIIIVRPDCSLNNRESHIHGTELCSCRAHRTLHRAVFCDAARVPTPAGFFAQRTHAQG